MAYTSLGTVARRIERGNLRAVRDRRTRSKARGAELSDPRGQPRDSRHPGAAAGGKSRQRLTAGSAARSCGSRARGADVCGQLVQTKR